MASCHGQHVADLAALQVGAQVRVSAAHLIVGHPACGRPTAIVLDRSGAKVAPVLPDVPQPDATASAPPDGSVTESAPR